MSDLQDLLDRARDHYMRVDLHKYFLGRADDITAAQVALDTAEDAMLALSSYESHGIGATDGEKYLRLYGFLQAAYVQQDSIKKLYKLFVGPWSDPPRDSAWARLRDLRNLTVGHPVERGKNQAIRRVFITRMSLETEGFDYQIWNKETGQTIFERADLDSTYREYKREAVALLEKVLENLSTGPVYSPYAEP